MRVLGNSVHRPVRRTGQLFTGLVLYGVSLAFMVESGLGLTSWDVFHQGVSRVTGLRLGWVVILAGIPILLLWIPLRQRIGFGTIANLVVVGLAVDGTLAVLPPGAGLPMRIAYLVTGIGLNAAATGLYIGARFGPGPRDGLMTGFVRRTGGSVRVIRTSIEVSVLAVGAVLGGSVGIGTVVYALGIGPLLHVLMPLFTVRPSPRSRLSPAPRAAP
jgi:uncharacterized membrane protein YczE